MDAAELARWTRFAAKGGIGKCTAVHDCVAEDAEDLMFLEGDEITVLVQLPDQENVFLGYCEGVVGHFKGADVRILGKLKKPVMTKRASSTSASIPSRAPSASSKTPSPSAPGPARSSDMAALRVLVSSPSLQGLKRSPPAEVEVGHDLGAVEEPLMTPPFSHSSASSALDSTLTTPPHFTTSQPQTREEGENELRVDVDREVDEKSIEDVPTPTPLERAPSPPQTQLPSRPPTASSPAHSPSPSSSHHSPPSRTQHLTPDKFSLPPEQSTRISIAMSDGEVGIGLSLLQGMTDGDGDDWDGDSTVEDIPPLPPHLPQTPPMIPIPARSRTQSHASAVSSRAPSTHSPAARSEAGDYWEGASDIYDDYRYSRSSIAPSMSRSSMHAAPPVPRPETRESQQSFQTQSSKYSETRPSTESERPPPLPRESQQSFQTQSSRYSETQPLAHSERAPPVPRESQQSFQTQTSAYSHESDARPSIDSSRGVDLHILNPSPALDALASHDARAQPSGLRVANPDVDRESMHDEDAGRESLRVASADRGRPAPLDLGSATSPLLHTTFPSSSGTSMASWSPHSSVAGPSPHVSSSLAGVASALRAQIEQSGERVRSVSAEREQGRSVSAERERGKLTSVEEQSASGHGHDIVVEDDEPIHIPDDLDEDPTLTMSTSTVQLSPPPSMHLKTTAPLNIGKRSPGSTPSPSPRAQTFSQGNGPSLSSPSPRAETFAQGNGPNDLALEELTSPPPPAYQLLPPSQAKSPSPPSQAAPLSPPPRQTSFPQAEQQLSSAPPAQSQHQPSPPAEPQARPRPPREGNGDAPAPETRTSLFLPHPNAPKPPTASAPAVPMYARATGASQPPPNSPQATSTAVQALHKALSRRNGPNGMAMRVTVFGRCEPDLYSATGPVPIMFSSDPFPPMLTAQPPPRSNPLGTPSRAIAPSPLGRSVSEAPSAREAVPSPLARSASAMPAVRDAGPSPLGQIGGAGPETADPSPSSAGPSVAPAPDLRASVSSGVIPRANFFPKAGTVRPRSRSFSDFSAGSTEKSPSAVRSREEGSKPLKTNSVGPSHLSQSLGPPSERPSAAPSTNGPSQTPSSDRPTTSPSPSQSPSLSNRSPPHRASHSSLRTSHAPSPLSLPQNIMVSPHTPQSTRSPSSPLAQSSIVNPFNSSAASKPQPPRLGLRHAASFGNDKAPSPLGTARPPVSRINTGESENDVVSPSSVYSSSTHDGKSSINGHGRTGTGDSIPQPWAAAPRRDSLDTDGERSPVSPTGATGPSSRHPSLRSKLSMPSLRGRSSFNAPRPEEGISAAETVQVKDMDFELVRPSLPIGSARTSEDSAMSTRNGGVPDVRVDAGHLRSESPTNSMISGPAPRPSTSVSDMSANSASKRVKSPDQQASVEAHRQRELKWMQVMQSTPASQARKSKKVKKLLMEGVPSSVRYLVWAHLTDAKAKGMLGLFAKMSKRDRVPASADIERDMRKFFMDQPHMQTTQHSLWSLLQAYFNMVPDIHYRTGLTFIAGHIVLLAPEEDAFWIFVSLMDSHLRPYFGLNNAQMDIDSALFSKAWEANDPQVAKKVLVELGINPVTICRPWFSALFAETLPIEYLHRVWDIFFCEGIMFLFRVGLAIAACCRRNILQATGEQAVLLILLHPQPLVLPPTPEAFVSFANAVKFKDDDVRKQRTKMEGQMKRQTQSRMTAPGGAISLPR